MKAYAKTVPIDRVKGRGGKKQHYCPCCISRKTIPGQKSQKSALRAQLRKEIKEQT